MKKSKEEVLIFYSGASWGMTGGGQRPQQIAQQMIIKGKVVIYLNHNHVGTRKIREGVWASEPTDFMKNFDSLTKGKRIISIICIPCRFEGYYEFADHIIYDIIDDWDQFNRHNEGGINWYDLDKDCELMNRADHITFSASYLGNKVSSLMDSGKVSRKRTTLIPNGGPDKLYSKRKPLEMFVMNTGERNIGCVSWVGSAWWDWEAVSQIDDLCFREGWKFHVIGDGYWSNAPRLTSTVRYGIVQNCDIDRLLTHCDTGVIPFFGPICYGVDPIKRYEYRVARIPTVAGKDLVELRGEPDVVMVNGNNWEDAIRFAIGSKDTIGKKITKSLIEKSSWSSRAKQFEEIIYELKGV